MGEKGGRGGEGGGCESVRETGRVGWEMSGVRWRGWVWCGVKHCCCSAWGRGWRSDGEVYTRGVCVCVS